MSGRNGRSKEGRCECRQGSGRRGALRACGVRGLSGVAPEQKRDIWLNGDGGVWRRARPSSGVREPSAKARATRRVRVSENL